MDTIDLVLKTLKENGALRMRTLAWMIKVNPDARFIKLLWDMRRAGLLKSRSVNDPANMQFYELWEVA